MKNKHKRLIGIGAAIRRQRSKLGLSQQQVAQRMGIQQRQISDYETENNIPGVVTLIRLAIALECKTSDILPGNY